MKSNDILSVKSLAFAVRIVNLYKYLSENKREFILSKQIMRSGTNPGAMVREASRAESGADFIHKFSIAQKELAETRYWLELLCTTRYINEIQFLSLDNDAEELLKLITKSIITRKQNLEK